MFFENAYPKVIPEYYKDTDNSFKKINIVSTLKNGIPLVPMFKDSNGIWKKSTVISQVCSIDKF